MRENEARREPEAKEVGEEGPRVKVKQIKLATDQQILDACADGVLGWQFTESAQLGISSENELSESSREARAVAELIISKKISEAEALNAYQEQVHEQALDKNRKIPNLQERLDYLVEKGLLNKEERQLFQQFNDRMGEKGFEKSDDYSEMRKAYFKGKALLFGLPKKDEAEQYGSLAATPDKNMDEKKSSKLYFLDRKVFGFSDEEANQAVAINLHNKKFTEYLSARNWGFSQDQAKDWERLIEEARDGKETGLGYIRRMAYFHLRGMLITSNSQLETLLAIRDFGLDRLYEYAYLREISDKQFESKNLAMRHEDLYRIFGPEEAEQVIAAEYRALEERKSLSAEQKQTLDQLISDLDNEPALKQFVYRWREPSLF